MYVVILMAPISNTDIIYKWVMRIRSKPKNYRLHAEDDGAHTSDRRRTHIFGTQLSATVLRNDRRHQNASEGRLERKMFLFRYVDLYVKFLI